MSQKGLHLSLLFSLKYKITFQKIILKCVIFSTFILLVYSGEQLSGGLVSIYIYISIPLYNT